MSKLRRQPLSPPSRLNHVGNEEIAAFVEGRVRPEVLGFNLHNINHDTKKEYEEDGIPYPTPAEQVMLAMFWASTWIDEGLEVPWYISRFLE